MKLKFKILKMPLDAASFNYKEQVNIPLYFIGPETDLTSPNPDRLWFCWSKDWIHDPQRKKYNVLYKLKKL